MKVKLLVEVRMGGKPKKANSTIDVEEPLAKNLIGTGRAVAVAEKEEPEKEEPEKADSGKGAGKK